MIAAMPDIFECPMCGRDPLPWWIRVRKTLLGDAPQGFADIGAAAPEAELAEITQGYDRLASFAAISGPPSATDATQA